MKWMQFFTKLKTGFLKLSRAKKILIIMVVAALVWFGYTKTFGTNKNLVKYTTAKVTRDTIISTLSSSGQIVSAGNMPVTTQTSGVVKTVFVKNSEVVLAGQKLFEFTPDQQSLQKQTQAWASYLSAKSNLDAANQSMYDLQSSMFSKWKTYMAIAQNSTYQNSDGSPNDVNRSLPEFHIAQDDWLSTEAKYKNQQGVIAQTQASLTSAWNSYQAVSPIVTSPIAGKVEDITLVLGMVISPQTNSSGNSTAQRLATIKTDAAPIASFNLTEIDVTKVKADQKVTITLDALPGKTYTGKVVGVDRTGIVSSGVTNYPTTVQFDTQPEDVLSNMSATANIILASKDSVLLVPLTAVTTDQDQSTVRILQNGKPVSQPVEIGLTSDSQVEITSGLNEGDTVVTGTQTAASSTGTTSPFNAIGGRGGVGGGAAFRGR